jgi:hypothetical protein
MVYVRQLQRLCEVHASNGASVWFAPAQLVGADSTNIYLLDQTMTSTNANPQLVAIRKADGAVLWRSDDFVTLLSTPTDATAT